MNSKIKLKTWNKAVIKMDKNYILDQYVPLNAFHLA